MGFHHGLLESCGGAYSRKRVGHGLRSQWHVAGLRSQLVVVVTESVGQEY